MSLRATSAGFLGGEGIDRRRYFDPAFDELEVDRVWSHVWQMACREEQIPEVGDTVLYELADLSLIVVRVGRAVLGFAFTNVNARITQGPDIVGAVVQRVAAAQR